MTEPQVSVVEMVFLVIGSLASNHQLLRWKILVVCLKKFTCHKHLNIFYCKFLHVNFLLQDKQIVSQCILNAIH